MNKWALAMNAWRGYHAARRTEGSSLRGVIIGAVSVIAIVGITLLRGDLSATDVGVIATSISGLDAVLKYFIPDVLGGTVLVAHLDETATALSPIEMQGRSAGSSGVADRVRESSLSPDSDSDNDVGFNDR